jgi:hypothetical protein
MAHRMSMLKRHWACHNSRRTDNRWGKRVLEWRLRLGKRSVGCPQAMWSDNLRRTAGRSWMRVAERRVRNWRGLYPAVDCGGVMMMMMIKIATLRPASLMLLRHQQAVKYCDLIKTT